MKLALYLPRCLQRINLPFPEYKEEAGVTLTNVSKIVDENGSPSVCLCEQEATMWSLTWSMPGIVVICRGTHRRG